MSKALLVINMPKSCFKCRYSNTISDNEEIIFRCTAKDERFNITGSVDIERDIKCPLKPTPEKIDANDWHRMFDGEYKIREAKGYGYNACIDEILGENENE